MKAPATNNAAQRVSRTVILATVLLLLVLLCACPAQSRSGGSAGTANAGGTSQPGTTAAGSTAVPASKPQLSHSLERELPIDASYTLESVSEADSGSTEVIALSTQDTLRTSTSLLGRLTELGYDCGDNPSRILEGVEFSKQSGMVHRLFVKVEMDTDEKCRVILRTGS